MITNNRDILTCWEYIGIFLLLWLLPTIWARPPWFNTTYTCCDHSHPLNTNIFHMMFNYFHTSLLYSSLFPSTFIFITAPKPSQSVFSHLMPHQYYHLHNNRFLFCLPRRFFPCYSTRSTKHSRFCHTRTLFRPPAPVDPRHSEPCNMAGPTTLPYNPPFRSNRT